MSRRSWNDCHFDVLRILKTCNFPFASPTCALPFAPSHDSRTRYLFPSRTRLLPPQTTTKITSLSDHEHESRLLSFRDHVFPSRTACQKADGSLESANTFVMLDLGSFVREQAINKAAGLYRHRRT